MTPEEFWSRPSLAHVQAHARASMVSPWSLIGSVVARVIVTHEPPIVLPPIIGGPASLNIIVALVGSSAAGKGTTESAARSCIETCDPITELPLGSGEGIGRTFAPPPPPRKDQPPARQITRALLTADEVDTVSAISARQGSSLMPTLRKVYSGEVLGAANSSADRRVIVPSHSYRACVVIGVQPERAGVLASDTAGTRQRVLWLPTMDPDCPDVTPPGPPKPWPIRELISFDGRRVIIGVPDEVRSTIRDHRRAVLRGDPDIDLTDGHRMLTRLKVAAGLMLLDGRPNVTLDDWERAGVVMAVSDRTRAHVDRTLAENSRAANRARANAVADRDEVVASRKVQRAMSGVLARLDAAGTAMPRTVLRKALRSDLRAEIDPALDALIAIDRIVETPSGYVLTGGQGDTLSTTHIRSSVTVDAGGQGDKPT